MKNQKLQSVRKFIELNEAKKSIKVQSTMVASASEIELMRKAGVPDDKLNEVWDNYVIFLISEADLKKWLTATDIANDFKKKK